MMEIQWLEAEENDQGINTIAFEDLGKDIPNVGRIVGYNGKQKGDWVVYKNKEYRIIMVSRMGDFGLSETGELPYTFRVSPNEVYKN